MLNRQIQVKIFLLGLTGTANVSEVFPDVPGKINSGGSFLSQCYVVCSLISVPHRASEGHGVAVTKDGANSRRAGAMSVTFPGS